MPEISVIVPVYKAEKTLSRCVDSILSQTMQDIELILVDDGSPDRSGAICDEYAKADHRIRVIHKPNGGAASARNAGLKIVSGAYVTFCDSDDYVSPEWCRWMLDGVRQDRVHTAICGVESVFQNGRVVHQGVMPTQIAGRSAFLQMAPQVSLYITCNKLFKTELIRQHRLRFDEEVCRCEDVMFTLRYLRLMEPDQRIVYGSEPLYHYIRCNEESLSRRFMKNLWSVERQRCHMTAQMLEAFGFSAEERAGYYSSRTAYSASDAIANVFAQQDASALELYRDLDEIISSPEFHAAVSGGGIREVAGGTFLKLLETKQTMPIFLYCTLSKLKQKKTRR